MADEIARAVDALDRFDVSYETTATDTVVEADTADEVFAAVKAAHDAIGGDRVITSFEIDDRRDRRQNATDRVAAVERRLGRPARRQRSRNEPAPASQSAEARKGRPAGDAGQVAPRASARGRDDPAPRQGESGRPNSSGRRGDSGRETARYGQRRTTPGGEVGGTVERR